MFNLAVRWLEEQLEKAINETRFDDKDKIEFILNEMRR